MDFWQTGLGLSADSNNAAHCRPCFLISTALKINALGKGIKIDGI